VAAPASVEAYLAALPEDRRLAMEQLGAVIVAAAPGATLTIAYGMPALRVDGHFLVSWAAFKQHFSLFPASTAVIAVLGEDVAPYVAGKGTLRFPADVPLPTDLIRRIIGVRLDEEAAAAKLRPTREGRS
jgi:uncharacterized protein YdhG (YjbR/CyaY superfamily)